ncbi:hypothetical protein APSETT444_007415 [Aspergillus pseudonomiae]
MCASIGGLYSEIFNLTRPGGSTTSSFIWGIFEVPKGGEVSSPRIHAQTHLTFTFTIAVHRDCHFIDPCGNELNGPPEPVIGVDIARSDATHLSMAVLVRDVARMVDMTAHSGPDLAGKDDAFAKAQGSALLAHHTSAQDPQASNIWLMRAIQNAMIVGCGPGPGDSQINLSMMKRLWWSMVLRDRVLSIGLRRRPQITSVEFNMGANWLTEEDFADEIVNSRVYDPELKIELFQVLQEQCKLAVLLTDMVALVFSSQGVSSPSLSLTEFQAVLAAIRRIKRYLTKWEAVSIVPPAARVDLAQYEALIIEKHLSFTGTNYRGQLLETGADLRKAMTGLTSAIEFFCGQGRAERMPLSVLAYTAVPLVLAAIDVKLSPSQAEMTIRKRRLDRLGEIVRHSRMLYDVADYVAAGTNHILQLAYITTQEAFLRCGTNAIGSSQMVIEPPSVGRSLDTTAKRVTNWYDAFLSSPRAYLRISITLDYSLATGRLPYDNALPLLVRQTPWAKKQQRLPWTIGLDTYDTSQCPEIAPNGRLTEDVGSISQIDSLPEEQAADSPEDDSSESRHDDVFKFITAIGESIRETAYQVEASCSPEETNVGEAAINLNFFEFGSPQSDDIMEMHALSGDPSGHLGTGASLSGKDRSDDGGFGPTGFQSIYTSLLRDSVV